MSRRTNRRARRALAALCAVALAVGVAQPIAAQEAEPEALAAATSDRGYVAVDAAGDVGAFGQAKDDGDLTAFTLNQPVVDVDTSPTGRGYWMAASDGGVFTFGDAGFHGSLGALTLDQPVVGIAATPSGNGYWMAAADGGVFAFGDAMFHGSLGGITLDAPVVAIAASNSGGGYVLAAADGGVFTFGDAAFHGSAGGTDVPAPIVDIAVQSNGGGYWLTDGDGRVYAYGGASDPVDPVEQGITGLSVVSIDATASGHGAWIFTDTGAAYPMGSAFATAQPILPAAPTASATTDPFIAAALMPDGHFSLTVLHNNDGESAITPDGDVGGIAFFANTVGALRAQVETRGGGGSILVSSGDNFLASAALSASFDRGVPWYDSVALNQLAYDAYALGNHEFDFGPDALVDFLSGFDADRRFLSANLDFSAEPGLQALVDAGQIAPSTVVDVGGRRVGIVGATTPGLATISSPRNTVIDPDVGAAIQTQVDALTASGVNIIVLISHLQDVDADRALVGTLSGVDIVVAGGGDELLANEGDALAPGDSIDGPYPIIEMNADGAEVPVVTTAGDYTYVGRLEVTFDAAGDIVGVEDGSGPVLVTSDAGADPTIQSEVVDPVAAFEAALAETTVATSEVELEADRGSEFGVTSGKRVQETNLGNLFADALLWQGQQLAGDFGVDSPQVAIQNGGGIRNDSFSNEATTPFPITRLDTFDLAPFANFVTVIEDLTPTELEAILEVAYGEMPGSNGSFAQIAGMTVNVEFDSTQLDAGAGVNPSVDVTDITLDGGTQVLVANVPQAVTVDLVTIDFLARGGDGYPIPEDAELNLLGASYQEALENFLSGDIADGALGGMVTAADYPEVPIGGGTRIIFTDTAV